jgi:hypothetical protein
MRFLVCFHPKKRSTYFRQGHDVLTWFPFRQAVRKSDSINETNTRMQTQALSEENNFKPQTSDFKLETEASPDGSRIAGLQEVVKARC